MKLQTTVGTPCDLNRFAYEIYGGFWKMKKMQLA